LDFEAEHLPRVRALDGLRGLAVAAVMCFHARVFGMHGGFLGVSAFFTLSGFLITSLLLAEHARPAPPEPQRTREHQREGDVELLLDRERPEVQHRRRSAEQLRIRPADCEEVPVRDVPERREHVAA